MIAQRKKHFYLKILIIILLMILFVNISQATENYWEIYNTGLTGGNIRTIVVDPQYANKVYAGTFGGGFYWSDNALNSTPTWRQQNTDLPNWNILSLMVRDRLIYAGTTRGLFYLKLDSIAYGKTHWIRYPDLKISDVTILNLRNCNNPNDTVFYAIGYRPNELLRQKLFIFKNGHIIDSSKSVISNLDVYSVIPFRTTDNLNEDILGKIYVGTSNGVFRFWNYFTEGNLQRYLHDEKIICLARRLIKIDGDSSESNFDFATYVGSLKGGRISVGSNQNDWPPFLKDSCITNLVPWFSDTLISNETYTTTKIYAITKGAHILYNTEIYKKDEPWIEISRKGLPPCSINSFVVKADMIDNPFLGTNEGIHYKANDNYWISKDAGNFHAHRVHALIHDNQMNPITKSASDRLWAGTDGVLFYRDLVSNNSSDNSQFWERDEVYKYVTDIELHPAGTELYLGTKGGGVFRKTKNNNDLSAFNNGGLEKFNISDFVFENKKIDPHIYAGTEDGKVFKWNYSAKRWEEIILYLDPEKITSIAVDSIEIKDGNILYVGSDSNIYKANSASTYNAPPLSWNSSLEISSVVFNQPSNELFAGTSNGIWHHPVSSEIDVDWNPYLSLLFERKNVLKLDIIPTNSRFKGILYAMVSDSSNRFTQVYRNVIGETTLVDSSSNNLQELNCQSGESFCVNLNNPNIVYVGTKGSGVYKFEFNQGRNPDIRPDTLDFGDVPKGSKKTMIFSIKNNFLFSPLIISFVLKDMANFKLSTSDSVILPGSTGAYSLTFNPQVYDSIKSDLEINWRDIYFNPVIYGKKRISLAGSGKGGDLIINGKADDIFSFYYKRHVCDSIIETLNWEKVGNVKLTNFRVIAPKKHEFQLLGSWEDSLNSKPSGELQFSFHPYEMSMVPDSDSIVIKFDRDTNDSGKKTIFLAGKGLNAKLLLNRSLIDFTEVPEKDYKPDSVYLANIGNIPLFVNSIYIAKNDTGFKILSCPQTPFQINAVNGGEELKLIFRPNKIDSFKNSLIITHYDSGLSIIDTTKIALIGKGVKNKVAPFPSRALNFDTVHVKKLPKIATLNITNISSEYIVWVDTIYCTENGAFRIINPHKFVLDSAGTVYDSEKVFIEFFADSEKTIFDFLGKHRDLLNIDYRYGIDSKHTNSAIRSDTLRGFIVSSVRQPHGNQFSWLPKVLIDSSADTTFTFKNMGNIPLNFKLIQSPLDTCYSFNFNRNPQDSLKQNDEVALKFGFNSYDTSAHKDILKIHFWDFDLQQDICVNDTIEISLGCKGIDKIKPVIDAPRYTQPIWKQPDTVMARVYDKHSGIRTNSLSLFIRKGGDSNFRPIRMEDTGKSDSTFYAIIPGTEITSKGIEFFIKAVDNAGTENFYPTVVSEFRYLSPPVIITEPGITKTKDFVDDGEIEFVHGGNAKQDYRFISIPLDSLSHSTKDIFLQSFGLQDYHEHTWRCVDFYYDSNSGKTNALEIDSYNSNKQFSEFIPGKSFLLLVNYLYPKRFIQKQTGKTISTNQIFQYPLHKGWNFIANPFNFKIPIENVSLADSLYAYEVKRIKVIDQEKERQYLFPWEGNAVYAEKDAILSICPNLNPENGPTRLNKSLDKPEYDWFISIAASCQKAQDDNNIAAISKKALIGIDDLDCPEPPSIGEYVKVSFSHPEWEKACDEFAVDVQPPNNEGNFWDFTISTNISNSEVKLRFDNLNSVPGEVQVFLICENLNIIQDLRKKNELVFKSSTKFSEHIFRLLIGTEDFIDKNDHDISEFPKEYRLFASYPNPFHISTEIQYELPNQEQVTILIYNILGEIVRKIEQKVQLPGKHSAFWDGTDEKKLPVRNGLYFCKFVTPNYSKTIKMTLMR